MNLRELEVYGVKTSNLARACSAGGCPVTSRSVGAHDTGCCYPSYLVDGYLTTMFHSQIGSNSNEWVIIDLQESMYVTMVRIFNRPDRGDGCCAQRLNNFEIRVGNLESSSTFSSNPACATNQPWFDDKKDFTCVLSGRYVSVQQISNEIMNIREIEVYGLKASEWCAACFAGTFKTTTGSAACADCAAGKYQDAAVVTTNPPEAARWYSGNCGCNAIGTGHARSMLDSAGAWSAAWDCGCSSAVGQWMIIDLGRNFRVHGVVTQCRAEVGQYVTEMEVQYSLTTSDFISARTASGNTRFFLPAAYSSTLKTSSIFSQPVTARYIKFIVYAWVSYASMRAGVLTLSTLDGNPCAFGYAQVAGDIPDWGTIEGRGGGESVQSCGECAVLCSRYEACKSYECSATALRCNLNSQSEPTQGIYLDYAFCVKKLTHACADCGAGKYSNATGATMCVDCGVSTYSGALGATAASTCTGCSVKYHTSSFIADTFAKFPPHLVASAVGWDGRKAEFQDWSRTRREADRGRRELWRCVWQRRRDGRLGAAGGRRHHGACGLGQSQCASELYNLQYFAVFRGNKGANFKV
ncbi:MAG: hypothetical protein EBR09_16525 [Proteobacteria bacterium]|nr:hypothetical protein [Pseudomonadota bacterium]